MARLSVDLLHRNFDVSVPGLQAVFQDLASLLELDAGAAVDLVVCTDVRIARLNRLHFGKRGSTDVIAFPTDFPELDFPGDLRYLGEIFLCADQVARNARRFEASLGDEFLFCFVHGLLHLLGWIDETPEARAAMHGRQRELMTAVLAKRSEGARLLRRRARRKG